MSIDSKTVDGRYSSLEQWFADNGGSVHGTCIDIIAGSGIGILATEDLTLGTVAMCMPPNLCIHAGCARSCSVYGKDFQWLQRSGTISDMTAICLYMTVERTRGRQSFWWPYIELLPSNVLTPLSFPSQQQLRLLQGTPLQHLVHDKRAQLCDLYHTVCSAVQQSSECVRLQKLITDGTLSFQAFAWGYQIFWSRVFYIPQAFVDPASSKPVLVPGMLPMVDLMNHDNKPTVNYDLGLYMGTQHLVVTVTNVNGIAQGQQLINSYGAISNERLLFQFGFTLQDNVHDTVLLDGLNFGTAARTRLSKCCLLRDMGLGVPYFVTLELLLADLLAWARIWCLSAEDREGWRTARKLVRWQRDPHRPLQGMLSIKNERWTCRTLRAALRRMLQRVKGVGLTAEAVPSVAARVGLPQSVVADILRYREGQSCILRAALQELRLYLGRHRAILG